MIQHMPHALRNKKSKYEFVYRCLRDNSKIVRDVSLLQIEVIEEYFLYGLPNFIADIGGNMGLFLGCSILSLIEWFGEKFHYFKN